MNITMDYDCVSAAVGIPPHYQQAQQGLSQQCWSQHKQEAISSTESRKEKTSMFSEFKAYVAKHRDIIFTAVFVLLVDEFFLRGALKDKITSLLNKVIDKYSTKTPE